jgi:hypothetical protein
MAKAAGGFTVKIDGIHETLKATNGLSRDLERPSANAELRGAAGTAAGELVPELQAAAAASGVPVASRVASTIRVKSDRIPAVSIGGPQPVGRYGAPASDLLWGSEHGGHNFAAGASSGYWIAPTVKAFGSSKAVAIYERAVAELLHRWGLD